VERPLISTLLKDRLRSLWPVLAAFAWAALIGWLCRALTRDSAGVYTIWLVNGFILSLLLTSDRKYRYQILAGAGVGILASASAVGEDFWTSLARTPVHVFEIWLAAKCMGWGPLQAKDLARPRAIGRFILMAVLLSCAAATALAWLLAAARGRIIPFETISASWVAHSLGMASIAPAGIVLLGPEIRRLLRRDRIRETLLLSALTVGIAVLVFSHSRYPLLFLVITPVLLVAFRGGFGGVALAVLATVAVAMGFTIAGMGPLMMIPNASMSDRIHLLQVFLAWLMLNMFPVVVAVSEHRRAYRALNQMKDRFRLLADYSSDVIVLTDLSGRRLFVSPSVSDVLGWDPAAFLGGTFRDVTDADTVRSIDLQLQELALDKGKTTIVFRARRFDGTTVWLEAHVQHFCDKGFVHVDPEGVADTTLARGPGGDEGFVVILRDVTRRRNAEVALQTANNELESLAWKDGLTGLGNRRRFDDVLATEWSRAVVEATPIAVLMLDVDHFKAYNDRYGHQQGDQCLAAVAAAIAKGCFRASDVACRYGGEEFAVIASGASIEQAFLIADRIRTAIEQIELPHEGSPMGRVTVSVGVAGCVPRRSGEYAQLVAVADAALYDSKRGGRNAVVTSHARALGETAAHAILPLVLPRAV
jgi:diguanylate cyclase (GGDEF)-like protein/PAS domain S-box-containing protein